MLLRQSGHTKHIERRSKRSCYGSGGRYNPPLQADPRRQRSRFRQGVGASVASIHRHALSPGRLSGQLFAGFRSLFLAVQETVSFRDSRASIVALVLLSAIGLGLGLAMVLSPSSFVSEPSGVGRGIHTREVAFVLGFMVLGLTAYMVRLSYRRVRTQPPAIELSPGGLAVSPGRDPIDLIPWQDIDIVEVEWDERVQYLVVRTATDLVRVPHTQVSANLERVCRAINDYRAHLAAI